VATHTLVASNALTNVIIAELPCTDAHHLRTLNDNGTLEASIPMDDPATRALALVANNIVEPAAVSIYCQRDQTWEWGGLLTAHAYDSKSALLKITASEFGSYAAWRYIQQLLAYSDDVANLASSWSTQVFADNGPPLLTTVTTTGLAVTGSFNPWEQHNVLDLIKSYQAMAGGYDWSFDVALDGNGNPCANLVLSYPRRGVSFAHSGVAWDYPGAILSFQLTKTADPASFDTDILVTGAGSGATLLLGEATITAPGYVKVQQVISNANLVTQSAVNAFATGTAKARSKKPLITVSAIMPGDTFYGSGVTTGDEVTLSLVDPYRPDGLTLPVRIIGVDTVFQTTSSPELVTMTFGPPLGA
jgi:hypothetical protein